MLILSFARTTAALIAWRKSVTRREWTDAYAAKFLRQLDAAKTAGESGLLVQAWSMSPRFRNKGARRIGTIRVLSIDKQRTCEIPESDWEDEGFAYMAENEIDLGPEFSVVECWNEWRQDPQREAYTIRFEVESIEDGITPEMFFGRAA